LRRPVPDGAVDALILADLFAALAPSGGFDSATTVPLELAALRGHRRLGAGMG